MSGQHLWRRASPAGTARDQGTPHTHSHHCTDGGALSWLGVGGGSTPTILRTPEGSGKSRPVLSARVRTLTLSRSLGGFQQQPQGYEQDMEEHHFMQELEPGNEETQATCQQGHGSLHSSHQQ